MSLEGLRVPDLSIGATVLIVAIALPFFVLTRAEHLQRSQAKATASPTPAATQAANPTSDPTATPAGTPSVSSLPLTGPSATAKPTASTRTRAAARPTASSTATDTATPPPTPTGAPVASLDVTPAGPLTVSVDASGSSDTAQTPIEQVIFDFGDGTTLPIGMARVASHTYASPGQYYVSVLVIDSVKASSTAGQWITV